jgi:hypothetical protein
MGNAMKTGVLFLGLMAGSSLAAPPPVEDFMR